MPVCARIGLNGGKQVDLTQKKTKKRTEQKEEKNEILVSVAQIIIT